MDLVIGSLENQLKYNERLLEDEKGYAAKAKERLEQYHETIAYYESLIEEYSRAISILRNAQ